MTTDTTTSGLPELVPFSEQHDHVRAPFYVQAIGAWVQDCRCGAAVRIARRTAFNPPSTSKVLEAFERHYRTEAALTPEQCRVLRAAEADFAGMLPSPVAKTTLNPLAARGLITRVGPEWQRRGRITGRGRGLLAEHNRLFA